MNARCPLCQAPVLIAATYGQPIKVDPIPNRDGNLTLFRRGLSWHARQTTSKPDPHGPTLYRRHQCVKASAA